MNVSVICACKNREESLLISLQSWMLFEEIKEIIIVDWNSDEPLNYLTEGDPRIKVIRVPNKKYFNQPQPLNLAASIATGDYILKLDTDHVINPYWNFFKEYTIDKNNFVSGKSNYQSPEYVDQNGIAMVDFSHMNFQQTLDYCNAYSAYYKSLIGLLYVTRDQFFKCGGFNENLGEFYGYEDSEFQTRLELLGLNHKKLNYDYQLFHIPHPDSKRIEYFEGSDDDIINQMKNNLSEIYSGEQLNHQLEYAITQHHITKNRNKFSNPDSYYVESKTKWNLEKLNEQNYIATEMNKLNNFPPIYYVTLEENKSRQDLLERQFEKYGLVSNAVKSKRFSESNDIITGKYVYQLTGPTQGCITSHLKAIKQWYKNNESEYAFFCEDDLSLKTVEHWNFTWEEFIERLPEDCECVQLMTIRGDFDRISFRERKWDDWSETAYIMNRDYAKKLIDNYCTGDTFHLELKELDVMPIGENILFTNIGKVYTFPLFVENVDIPTTDVNDLELIDGQKPNHVYASEYVYNWWRKNGKNKSIDELINVKHIEKSFEIMKQPDIKIKHNVVDCFTYFNEKELLELRVNLLKNHVDKFIITDANYTFSGNLKEYSCKETIQELGLPQDMIEVIEVDLSEENLGEPTEFDKSYHPDRPSRERIQRDSIAKCLETNSFDDDTVFIVSDCDEIINPEYISILCNHARTNRNKIFKADLVHLEGRADFRVYEKNNNKPREWRYSLFVCLKEHMQHIGLNSIRADFDNPYEVVWPYIQPRIENGTFIPGERMMDLGWHFSWMGDNQNRLLKSESFSHAGQSFDFIAFNNYSDERMKEFILNYDIGNESISPSGDINCHLKPYSIEDLPSIILSLPRVKKYLLPDLTEKNQMTKTELEQLLYDFSMDTENPQKNFNIALWYEREGHTAPALSYFLRTAERAEDDEFAYESLLKSHHCYDRQGTRDVTAISLLQQAMCLLPKRPEAYFLLARFHERRQQWNDSYKYASLGLSICDFDCTPLTSDVDYPGKYGLIYEKAVSSYWWGKSKECRELFLELKNNHNHEMDEIHRSSVGSNLMSLGCWVDKSIKYEKSRFDEFKFKFPGLENIEKSNGQALQDMFILSILNGKRNGTYLEIGAQEPFFQNNTALLETDYDWKGVSIEIREDLCKMFEQQRRNTILCQDATKINYEELLDNTFNTKEIDYLQVDCEPSKTTFEILLDIPFDKYKFAVITYEHDFFVDMTETYRTKSRNYLKMMGYELVVSNASQNENTPFEDWWVHPDLIDKETIEKFRSIKDVTDVREYFYS
jgi:GR25 family glycosyltransferase involved in LPS biosynthesis